MVVPCTLPCPFIPFVQTASQHLHSMEKVVRFLPCDCDAFGKKRRFQWRSFDTCGAHHRRVDQRRRAAVGSAAAVFTVAAVNQIPIALALVVAQVWAAEGGWANSAPLLFGRPVLKNSHSESWQTWLISCGLGLTCICQVRSASYNRVHAPHHFCTKLQARHGA